MSMAKLAILGALKEKPMHGYELRKYFEHAQGVFWMINYGSIYPTLKNMENDGLIKIRSDSRGEYKGRKTYSITLSGEEEFSSMLKERLNKESFVRDEFTLHLFFLDYLGEKEIRAVIQKKIEGNKALLDGINKSEDFHKKTLPRFRYEAVRRGRMHIETELLWLNCILNDLTEV